MNAPTDIFQRGKEAPKALKPYKPTCGMAEHCFAGFMGNLNGAAQQAGLKGRTVRLSNRTEIFQEGDKAGEIFEVEEGLIMLSRLLFDGRRQIVEILGKGDLFGISYDDCHDTTAEALGAAIITAFDRKSAEQDPAMQRMMANATRKQLQKAHEHVVTLGRKTAQEKVASYLMRIMAASGNKRELCLPMTRLEIADFLGLTIETVSRVISSFKRSGMITDLCGEKLRIADVDALEDLAQTVAFAH